VHDWHEAALVDAGLRDNAAWPSLDHDDREPLVAAADIPLRLAVGWDGANESSSAVRMLIDADADGDGDGDGAITGVVGALAEAACDRVQHRGPLSGNQRDG
jgi:hypothetical protein